MASGRVDCDQVIGLACKGAFENPIVRLVCDGRRREKRQAQMKLRLDLPKSKGASLNTRWYSARISGLTYPRKASRRQSSTMTADLLIGFGSVASFRTHVSRVTFKIGLRGAEGMPASLALDELDCLLFGHGFATISSPRLRQARRQLQPHNLPIHYCSDSHAKRIALPTDMLKQEFSNGSKQRPRHIVDCVRGVL